MDLSYDPAGLLPCVFTVNNIKLSVTAGHMNKIADWILLILMQFALLEEHCREQNC